MSCKTFSTLSEQIEILKSRGMVINNESNAQYILSRENYYNVINGYKKPFLKKDLAGINLDPEAYIDKCSFEEVYGLGCFDRELRNLLLGFLLKFETHFKTVCAYYFSEKFRDNYAYLTASNYSNDKADLSAVLSNIATLSKEINDNTRKSKSAYINHYIVNYDCVPLWVLVNSLTIGNMSYFYNAIDVNLKEVVAKEFSTQYKKDYGSLEKIGSDEMKEILKAVNLFRNVCAHEEVLFLFKLDKPIKSATFVKYFVGGAAFGGGLKESNLYTLVCLLKLVLPKSEYNGLLDALELLFKQYAPVFKVVNFADIVKLSGFNSKWKEGLL